jgi:hypothetical protein
MSKQGKRAATFGGVFTNRRAIKQRTTAAMRHAALATVEYLEPRQLLSGSVPQWIPVVFSKDQLHLNDLAQVV